MIDRRFPLVWPAHIARTPAAARTDSQFRVTGSVAWDELMNEAMLFSGDVPVISCNAPRRRDGQPYRDALDDEIEDPGVAVYLWVDGVARVFPCDAFTTIRANARAISLTITALRTMQRYGIRQMLDAALGGFAALPPPDDWRRVLGLPAGPVTADDIQARYKALARSQPDEATMQAINVARDQAIREVGGEG